MRWPLILGVFVLLVACGEPAPKGVEPPPSQSETEDSGEDMQARLATLPPPYDEAAYDAGRRVFAQCRSCHTLNEGGGNRVGPNLHGLFGREIGTAPGFNYSQPVRDADFVWDADRLDDWLQNPQTFLPGNRMAFAGVRDETQRRDLIGYLMVETAD